MAKTFHRPIGWAPLEILRRLFLERPLITLSVPVFLGLASQPLVRCCSEFMNVYVGSAGVLLDGGDIYGAGHGYAYPPLAALLAVPFVPMPEFLARLVWYFINVGAIVALIRCAWGMAGGAPLGPIEATDRREWLAFGLGLVWIVPYLLNALSHEQTDIVIAALLTSGCYMTLRGRPMVGAVLIGLSATFKGPTLLFLGYLVFRRRWRAAALALAVAIGANLVPDLVDHQSGGTLLGEWVTKFALPAEKLTASLGNWNDAHFNMANQSLAGSLQRVTNSTVGWNSGKLDIEARTVPVGPGIMKATAYTMLLLMAAISAWAALRGEGRMARETALPSMPSPTAIEFGAMMVLVLMMSPMSALAHYGLLAAPILCLARLAAVGRYRLAWMVISVGIVIALAMNKDLVGRTAYDLALWGGVTTLSAIGLWFGSIVFLAKGALRGDAHEPQAAVARQT